MTAKPAPGTRVRLTGAFLRNTGQHTGPEGFNVWTVQACACGLCKCGPFVLTNERRENREPDEPEFRHINFRNLEKAKS